VRAQPVRTADRRAGRDQVDGALRDPVVVGDAIRAQLTGPEGSEENCSGQRCGQHDRSKSGHPGHTKDGSCDQERRDRCRVVEFDRGLGRNLREQVRDELGQRRQEQERRGEKHGGERERKLEQVGQISALGERADQNERVGERGLDDPRRRPSDRGVALVEGRSGSLAEMRDDDPEVEGAADDSADRQQRAGNALPSR
jgi:hypothetical protein